MPIHDDYDDLAYGDLTIHDTHPGLMSAIGALAGLNPPEVATARVLELGCGTGFNLLAMSQSTPTGFFVGLDLNAAHIQRARESAAAIGATNVEFHCLSLTDFTAEPASFDYIIAHGVYSWVPGFVRDAIFRVIQRHLSPNGLAYVSYNTLPGWRLRGLVRDSLRFFTDPGESAASQVRYARAAVEQLTKVLPNADSIYSRALRDEWNGIRDTPDFYVAHEYLASENTAFFFEEFRQRAAAANLQFAAEARLVSNAFAQSGDIEASLDAVGGDDYIRREQFLDILIGRYFRQTLLCHAGLELDRNMDTYNLLDRNVTATVEVLERSRGLLRVKQVWDKEAEVTDAAVLAALEHLLERGVHPVPARDLEGPILRAMGMDGMRGMAGPVVASVLWSGWRNGFWALRTDQPAVSPTVPGFPTACPLARLQAATAAECTSRLHRPVKLTEAEREILQQLTGDKPASAFPPETLTRFAATGLLTTSA